MRFFIIYICLAMAFWGGCSMESEKESKNKPTEDQTLFVEGYKALAAKDPVKALQFFEKALAVNPENAPAYIFAGRIYLSAQREEDAIRVLAPGLKHLPNNAAIPYMLALAFKERGNFKQGYLAAKRAEEINEAWQNTEELAKTRMLLAYFVQEIRAQEDAIAAEK